MDVEDDLSRGERGEVSPGESDVGRHVERGESGAAEDCQGLPLVGISGDVDAGDFEFERPCGVLSGRGEKGNL